MEPYPRRFSQPCEDIVTYIEQEIVTLLILPLLTRHGVKSLSYFLALITARNLGMKNIQRSAQVFIDEVKSWQKGLGYYQVNIAFYLILSQMH